MSLSRSFLFLGLFLLVAGLVGYLSNPAGAKTALLSGGIFGTFFVVCSVALQKGFTVARWVGWWVIVFLIAIFTWRASVSWMAVAAGESTKLIAALLISAMLLASLTVGWMTRPRRGA